jgi:NAD(P)-dependent dehydrogenase (short-subunit alcohol dehydrogenase family)
MVDKERVWLITGASRGLGRSLAELALEEGDRVVLAVRDPSSVANLVHANSGRARAIKLDVSTHSQIQSAVIEAENHFGRVDILMSNAGYVLVGAVEEAGPTEYRTLFDTNFFGALEVIRAVLPAMRGRRSGHILAMSAMGGFVSSAGLAYYCATKAALESICEGLDQEVRPLGNVTIVQPGNFRTSVIESRVVAPEILDYGETAGVLRRRFATTAGTQPGDPKLAARAIVAVTRERAPPLRLPLGADAIQRISAKLAQVREELERIKATALATTFES